MTKCNKETSLNIKFSSSILSKPVVPRNLFYTFYPSFSYSPILFTTLQEISCRSHVCVCLFVCLFVCFLHCAYFVPHPTLTLSSRMVEISRSFELIFCYNTSLRQGFNRCPVSALEDKLLLYLITLPEIKC